MKRHPCIEGWRLNPDKKRCRNYTKYQKILPQLCKIHSKSAKNCTKINENASWERFRRQIAPRSAPGRSAWEPQDFFWSLFGRKWCSNGLFRGQAGVQNQSKIDFLGLDRRRASRKMTSGRGVGKNMKNQWKLNVFWWLGTTFGVILFAYFTLSAFLKHIEKSMPKVSPFCHVFGKKNSLERSRVALFINFAWFLMVRKIKQN